MRSILQWALGKVKGEGRKGAVAEGRAWGDEKDVEQNGASNKARTEEGRAPARRESTKKSSRQCGRGSRHRLTREGGGGGPQSACSVTFNQSISRSNREWTG